ncbi:MAG: hypothetical protein IKD07_06040 [Clostridia bacterium]|nr:hypothetical protein [Clostridia bacterium]
MLTEYMKYYYLALPPHKKTIYRELYDGFKDRRTMIDVHTDPRAVSIEEVAEVALAVYNDTPSFYYLDVSSYSWIPMPYGYRYSQSYLYSAQDIAYYDRYLEEGWQRFERMYLTPSMSEYDKEKAIHDYLVKTIVYDEAALIDPDASREAFNILGALIKKRAVCHGIACAFKYLCDCCRIKCFVVVGDALPIESNEKHAWNIVKIDDESYHVDVTWDIKKKGDISFFYDYFNLSDPLIRFDHTWQSDLYPPCTAKEHNYYYKNRLFVRSVSELTDFVANALKNGSRYIAVKFANDMPWRSTLEESIRLGFLQAKCFCSYVYSISEITHNIYIQIK